MKKKMNKKGFTLVEIIVVLVIIAIMAAFAIPAYTGFVDRAKQSETLATGRAILVAAQTAGQEVYAKEGALVGSGETVSADETTILDLVATYSGISKTSTTDKYLVTLNTKGVVTDIEYTKGNYSAIYDIDTEGNGFWTTGGTKTISTAVVIAP